jgi:hypothetical protein
MESIIRNVNDIGDDPRRWLESNLGHPLREGQQVMITILNVGTEPDEQTRREASEELLAIQAKAAANIAAQGVSQEEYNAVVDEAIAAVRRRKL